MKGIALVLLIIAFASEALAIYDLLSDDIFWAVIFHIAGSLLAACSLDFYFTPRNVFFVLLLFLLNATIPVFGMLVSIYMRIDMNYRHNDMHKYGEVFQEVINLLHLKPLLAEYGSGGLQLKLFSKQQSIIERTKALFTLGKNRLAAINQQLYQLLPDSMDEMRLLAFNILDKQEGEITKNINVLFEKMEAEQRKGRYRYAAEYQKELAECYWELIYHHLILPELETNVAETGLKLAHEACKFLQKDAGLQIIIAKLYWRLKDYSQAEQAFLKAHQLHALPSETIPYLAEIKYHARDFQAVQTLLNSDNRLGDIPPIAPVVEFWRK